MTIANNSEQMTKRPVISVLRDMDVNSVEYFPIIQLKTVRNTIADLKLMEGGDYKTKTGNGLVEVTRIA